MPRRLLLIFGVFLIGAVALAACVGGDDTIPATS
ncbi:MAG: hypothetical protein DK306_000309 [Chloroflexi bacterium]|jgi:hypothetical protein|nr:MAG: hypothetical protein DK306_000309 [Chloroflexota bacterium]